MRTKIGIATQEFVGLHLLVGMGRFGTFDFSNIVFTSHRLRALMFLKVKRMVQANSDMTSAADRSATGNDTNVIGFFAEKKKLNSPLVYEYYCRNSFLTNVVRFHYAAPDSSSEPKYWT
ncbi:hypothetical protein EVAR_41345_1 [Eumeta japonica]|uniref:Uncharacterized protein n=1 Tax=Eumeta variegata TaxID=151549 RepID=A0A4C1XP67_EUMVA|nr:hypothetical protein EVAR_41345_1 [Eumeta japonica]